MPYIAFGGSGGAGATGTFLVYTPFEPLLCVAALLTNAGLSSHPDLLSAAFFHETAQERGLPSFPTRSSSVLFNGSFRLGGALRDF